MIRGVLACRRLRRFGLLLLMPIAAGCAHVRPYQKEFLADPIMMSPRDAKEAARELKWLEAREASNGGTGGAGGGCACK